MADACTCLPCWACHGTGQIVVTIGGSIVPHRCDDLDTLEPCEECHTSGYLTECDYCRDQREMDEAADDDYFKSGTRYPGQ